MGCYQAKFVTTSESVKWRLCLFASHFKVENVNSLQRWTGFCAGFLTLKITQLLEVDHYHLLPDLKLQRHRYASLDVSKDHPFILDIMNT